MFRKRGKQLNMPLTILLSLILGVSLIVTFAPRLGLDSIPGWEDIYQAAGLRGSVSGDGEIHFIDVGQADCTLLSAGGGNILIDGGNNSDGKKIVRYLRDKGIKKLDYIIATHAHADHIGGLDAVIENIDTENIIISKSDATITRTYEDLLLAIKKQGVKVIRPKPGDKYSAGEISFRILAPAELTSEENENSVAVLADCGGLKLFAAGDAENTAISKILPQGNLSADVYKAGHHGSKTSNPRELLTAVKPKYIFIPVGENNSYGHPSAEVLELFEELEIPVYRADLNGSAVFSISDGEISVKTEK